MELLTGTWEATVGLKKYDEFHVFRPGFNPHPTRRLGAINRFLL